MAKKQKRDFLNYFDMGLHFITDLVNQRYKITQRVEDLKRGTVSTLYSLKYNFLKTLVEALFLITGLFAIIAGGILFLKKYFPLENLLLIYGFLVTIGVLLRLKLRV